jgi:ABC-2 type transport system permease protein
VKPVLAVAENEFSIIARSPITLLFYILIVIWAIVQMAGCTNSYAHIFDTYDEFFYQTAFSNNHYYMAVVFAFLSMCLGVVSITDGRSDGSLKVLMTKPLYRRDIIFGKFIGISAFILLLIALTLAIFTSTAILINGGPSSFTDLFFRAGAFAIVLFLNSDITLAVVMLFGIALNKVEALVISVFYMAVEWLSFSKVIPNPFKGSVLDLSNIEPFELYMKAMWGGSGSIIEHYIFWYLNPIGEWLDRSLPYLVLMLAEIILLVLINCMLFNREEA